MYTAKLAGEPLQQTQKVKGEEGQRRAARGAGARFIFFIFIKTVEARDS